MSADEQVLVLPTGVLESLGMFRGFLPAPAAATLLAAILQAPELRHLPRSRAEDDPTHKQLVPYVLLGHDADLFCYRRAKRGSESRLHDKWSLGIGGHVCADDGPPGADAFFTGLRRELAEEVTVDAPSEEVLLGLVHDDSTPVGAVHLGVVYLHRLSAPHVSSRDHALADGAWINVRELANRVEQMESWSALALQQLLQRSVS